MVVMTAITDATFGITLEQAQRLLDAAVALAAEQAVAQNIAVVDAAGHLVAFARMDGAKFMAIDIAINKAFTAAGARVSTAQLHAKTQPGEAGYGLQWQHGGRVTTLAGGLPVWQGDLLLGGVGISGGSVAQDDALATALAQAMPSLLKLGP